MQEIDLPRGAAPALSSQREAGEQKFLCFSLGQEGYGIAIDEVREVRLFEPPTRLAQSAAWMLGLLELRGEVLPVFDLRLRFGQPASQDEHTVCVLVQAPGGSVGLVVDAVTAVVDLPLAEIKPAPLLGPETDTRHLRGLCMAQDGERSRLLGLIDVPRLLASLNLH